MASLQVRYRPAAVDELSDAVDWYASQNPTAAGEFCEIIERKLLEASSSLHRWPLQPDGTRQILLGKFPYVLIVCEHRGALEVLAVAHASREPGYWRDRLDE
jgi:plasmid stabilization system protein ParE